VIYNVLTGTLNATHSLTSVTKFQGKSLSWGTNMYVEGGGEFAIFDQNHRLSQKWYEIEPWLV